MRAADSQLALPGGLCNGHFEGAQRAPNWLVQGARGPPIDTVSANTGLSMPYVLAIRRT
jgi:hypothetical protein